MITVEDEEPSGRVWWSWLVNSLEWLTNPGAGTTLVQAWEKLENSWYPSNRYQYATDEWLDLAHPRQRKVSVLSSFFWPVMMTLSLQSHQVSRWLFVAFQDDIGRDVSKGEGKTRSRASKSKIWSVILVEHWKKLPMLSEADSPANPEGFTLSTGFCPHLCIDQEANTPSAISSSKSWMKKARLLLPHQTDLKIYEIADQVGFEDMNYFQRFKQVVGVTPRQYKKEKMEWTSPADPAGPLLFSLLHSLAPFGFIGSLLIIKRVQGRSASKQSGRQEIVSIKAVSLSPPI